MLIGLMSLTGVVSQPLSGALSDRFGRRKMIAIFLALSGATVSVFCYMDGITVFPLAFLAGFMLLGTVSMINAAADIMPPLNSVHGTTLNRKRERSWMEEKIIPLKYRPLADLLIYLFALTVFVSIAWGAKEALAAPEILPNDGKTTDSPPYRVDKDGLVVHKGKVRPGDTLGALWNRYDAPSSCMPAAMEQVCKEFDPRKMRPGDHFTIYRKSNGGPLRFFIYELNPVDYLVVDFSKGVNVYRGQKSVERKTSTMRGTITGSLWDSLSPQNYGKTLALKLYDIFAWTVDFHRLKKGDGYSVIFDETLVEGRPVGIAVVRAARITHGGNNFDAFRFEQNGIQGYYDEKGRNLRKGFLKSPLRYGRITSRFSMSRLHPILKKRMKHLGTDFAAPAGTPILSVSDGIVCTLGYDAGRGNYVRIRHAAPYETEYLHMKRFETGIKEGDAVKQGQTIGYVGSTGLATGPHVDLRLLKNGKPVNFLKASLPPGRPLPARSFSCFQESMAILKAALIEKEGLFAFHLDVPCEDMGGKNGSSRFDYPDAYKYTSMGHRIIHFDSFLPSSP